MRDRRGSIRMPARYVALLVDYLDTIGVARDALLRAARLRTVDDPGAQVTLRQLEALLGAAIRASGRSDLGFEFGRRLDPTSHDLLGFAFLTSPTFDDVLRLQVTYQRLLQTAFALRLERSAGRVDLVYAPAVAMSPQAMRMLSEAIVVSNHLAYRAALGERLPPYDAWLSIESPAHAHRYRELAPARVHFGAAMTGVRFSLPAALLDAPLAMANPRAMRAAEERCKAMLRQVHVRRRWKEWCRTMLRESEDSQPTLGQLARIVNLSPRTLARYLETEGVGFRDLALQVRTERAARLLREGDLSVTQVAYRLGFSDVASFVRSYRNRTGRTPGTLAAAARAARRPG